MSKQSFWCFWILVIWVVGECLNGDDFSFVRCSSRCVPLLDQLVVCLSLSLLLIRVIVTSFLAICLFPMNQSAFTLYATDHLINRAWLAFGCGGLLVYWFNDAEHSVVGRKIGFGSHLCSKGVLILFYVMEIRIFWLSACVNTSWWLHAVRVCVVLFCLLRIANAQHFQLFCFYSVVYSYIKICVWWTGVGIVRL